MTTVVVHDSNRLTPEAIAGFAPGVMHAVARGAEVSAEVDEAQLLRFPNEKDPDFLDELMRWLDGALRTLDVPDLELARYRLLLEVAAQEHRWWVLQRLAREVRPAHVVMRRSTGPIARALDRGIQLQARAMGIDLQWQAAAMSPARYTERLAEAVFPHWDHARRGLQSLRARRERPDAGAVVFAESFPNSVQVLLPVEKALIALGEPAPLWLPTRREVSAALQAKAATPAVSLEALVSPFEFARAGTPSPAQLARLQSGLARLETFCLAGEEQLLHAGALALPFASAFVEAHRWRWLASAALDRLKPRAVISTSYSSVQGRAFALAAREHGAPSIFVQHGSYPDRFVWSFFLHDHKLMWGDYARASLLKYGHVPSSVHAVGAPHHDAFAVAAAQRPWARPVGRPWRLTYMASRSGGMVVSDDAARRTLRAVVGAVGRLEDTELVVKAHPGDATRIPEEETQGQPRVRLQRGGSSQDLILESDVVIVASSTTGFEACVAGRPLIELNLTGIAESAEYAAAGAALAVRESDALVETLQSLRTRPQLVDELFGRQRALLDRFLCGSDGRASDRVARFIASPSSGGRA